MNCSGVRWPIKHTSMSKKLRGLLIVTASVLTLIYMAGCSSSKNAAKQVAGETTTVAAKGSTPFESMVATYGDWTSLRVPVTLRVSGTKNLSIGGTATMVRDKSLTMSLRFFGMEIGSLYVGADSLVVIDKVNRQYMVQPVGDALAGFDVNISNLQDLLLGRVFLLGKEKLTPAMASDFKITDNADGMLLTPRKQPSAVSYSFMVNGGVLNLLTVDRGSGEPVTCTYADALETEGGRVAGSATVAAKLKDKPLELEFDWNFGKARWNDPSDVKDLKIPSGYTRRTAAEILKTAQKSL